MLLALDTATPYVTACVFDDDAGEVLAARDGVGPMKHGELLAPTLAEVLAQAEVSRTDLTAVVVGVGPGPYTGLRVGVVTALTLAAPLGIPTHGVCTLDAIAGAVAASAVGEGFLVTTDARRKELFWAAYDADGRREDGPHVARPEEIPVDGRPVAGAGPALHPDRFPRALAPRDPRACDLARLFAAGRAQVYDAEPIYLRRPDAVTPGPPKRVS